MFGVAENEFVRYSLGWYLNARTLTVLLLALFCCVPWKEILDKRIPSLEKLWSNPVFVTVKRVALLMLLAVCFSLIVNSTYNPFIYFRF
jgi:hypothetical protein